MLIKEIFTIVVGSGAAGLNAADRLYQYGVHDIALVTENINSGTSRNTGSDKQTYYKLSLAGEGEDSIRKLAKVLYDGGCVDGDHALCEAALSCQGFYKLVELGVPFPHDKYGEYVGYKTDHDPNDRGSSVGPYTSRYMTEALEQSVLQKGIPIYDHCQVIEILTLHKKIYGVLCLDTKNDDYLLIKCTNLIYATGGPAGMYADSVYPVSQFGASGLAFEAGVLGKNLTEWQYGLASLHPRWNVSGSYMQVLPKIVSTDQKGENPKEFLLEYYKTKEIMMNMVFLKGYQWPFDVTKVESGSSMIDLLVYRETYIRGRRVWLDYRSNPCDENIDFSLLSEEAATYLSQAKACQQTPYERLCHLNSPAVDFYLEHGVNLKDQRLEIAVCAQHNNGGLSVNAWWQTNVEGFFAVGEVAGTHGISRPGGSALNSGQVGSTRAAEYIAYCYNNSLTDNSDSIQKNIQIWTKEDEEVIAKLIEQRIAIGRNAISNNCNARFEEQYKSAARNMSRYAAMLRDKDGIIQMIDDINTEMHSYSESAEISTDLTHSEIISLSRFYRFYDMRLCQKVYLEAMINYIDHGVKSRGSAVYCEKDKSSQIIIPELVSFSLDGPDGRDHADQIQEILYDCKKKTCNVFWRNVRKLEDIPKCGAFEVEWEAYREKRIYN